MEKIELIKVYAYAELLWNTFKPERQEEKSKLQDMLWFDFLKNYNINVIFSAMRELAKESDFCNIAKVATNCETICRLLRNEITAEEIWENFTQTLKEVKETRYSNKLEEIFNSLDESLKRFVGGWRTLKDMSILEFDQLQFERSRFIKNYYEINKQVKLKNEMQIIFEDKKLLESV